MRLGLLSTAKINGEILRAAATTDRVEVAGAASGQGQPLLGRADALGQARAIEALCRSAETGRAVIVGS